MKVRVSITPTGTMPQGATLTEAAARIVRIKSAGHLATSHGDTPSEYYEIWIGDRNTYAGSHDRPALEKTRGGIVLAKAKELKKAMAALRECGFTIGGGP